MEEFDVGAVEPAPDRDRGDVPDARNDVGGRRKGRRVAAIACLSASGILAAVALGGAPGAATSAPSGVGGAAGLMLSAAFLVGGLLLARRGRPKEG